MSEQANGVELSGSSDARLVDLAVQAVSAPSQQAPCGPPHLRAVASGIRATQTRRAGIYRTRIEGIIGGAGVDAECGGFYGTGGRAVGVLLHGSTDTRVGWVTIDELDGGGGVSGAVAGNRGGRG